MRISESYRLCNKQTNLYVFVNVFKNVKNLERNKKIVLCHGTSKISKLISIQTVVGKVFRRNIQARLQFLFPKTKVTSIFVVGFLYSQHWWTKKIETKLRLTHFRRNIFRVGPKLSHNPNMIIRLVGNLSIPYIIF